MRTLPAQHSALLEDKERGQYVNGRRLPCNAEGFHRSLRARSHDVPQEGCHEHRLRLLVTPPGQDLSASRPLDITRLREVLPASGARTRPGQFRKVNLHCVRQTRSQTARRSRRCCQRGSSSKCRQRCGRENHKPTCPGLCTALLSRAYVLRRCTVLALVLEFGFSPCWAKDPTLPKAPSPNAPVWSRVRSSERGLAPKRSCENGLGSTRNAPSRFRGTDALCAERLEASHST